MTLGDAILTVSDRLGQRVALDALIKRELGLSQLLYESKEQLPWFLLRREVVPISSAKFSSPAGFLAEDPEEPLVRLILPNGGRKALLKRQLYEMESSFGVPSYYCISEPGYIEVWPAPDDVYEVELVYYGADTPIESLSTSMTNRWLTYAPLVLVNDAGYRVSMSLRSPETAQIFAAHLQEALSALWKRHYSMSMNARGMTMGG